MLRMKRLMLPLSVVLLLLPMVASAETVEEKGLRLAVEAANRDHGFGDFTADMVMTLRNKHGDESERQVRIKRLENKNDGEKGLSIFDSPRDVRGTVFLSHSHKKGQDDQWLYLPALKRVKRISSRNKSGSFMGSEFAYEDLSSLEVEKYTYKWLRDEKFFDHDCYVSESYPVDRRNSGYSRLLTWVDKDSLRPWKVEYYDRKNAHLKTLTFYDYGKYVDKYFRAGQMKMVNHQSGKSTDLRWMNYRFNTGLKDSDFSKNSLKRIK